LAALGFDACWHCIPASTVGALHRRDRVWIVANAHGAGCAQQRGTVAIPEEVAAIERTRWWSAEPDVGRVAYGVPARVDRLAALGNAVVPQVVELIGRAIVRGEQCCC
jgi:DNA (cytosine-5)-methyltransferase 1